MSPACLEATIDSVTEPLAEKARKLLPAMCQKDASKKSETQTTETMP